MAAGVCRQIKLLAVFLVGCCLIAPCFGAKESKETTRRVMAFYYPWYGISNGPGGNGRTVHWGTIDTAGQNISESTHYPAGGAYDSHDPEVIRRHCRQAAESGIDTLIVSWWGAGSYEDRAMPLILDACGQAGLKATVYYETVPRPQAPETAAHDIVEHVLKQYAAHPAWLEHDGRPVVFIYGRAVGEIGLYGWHQVRRQIEALLPGGAVLIGDEISYGAAAVFDGVHTYITAGALRDKTLEQVNQWCRRTYPQWAQTAREQGKISTLTVIPGYDDTKIRTPGLKVERFDGKLYTTQWKNAVDAAPDWILITSFNEWHEGSEIEPSAEYGDAYLKMTKQYAERFLRSGRERKPPAKLPLAEIKEARLREKLAKASIAVLPEPSSTAFWWLLKYKDDTKVLSWEEVTKGKLTRENYSIVLYCGGEAYRTTVREKEDVTAALKTYVKDGGLLVVLPSGPWPFYYDTEGKTVNHASRFGVTLKGGWERPPEGRELFFMRTSDVLLNVSDRIGFATAPDPRWRPFVQDLRHTEYQALIQLKDRQGTNYGDGLVIARTAAGGGVVYGWFGLFQSPHGPQILGSLFDLLIQNLNKSSLK